MRKMKDSGIEWIGEIPESWDICKLKYTTECRTEKTADKSASVPYIGLEHVKSDFGALVDEYSHILDFEGDTIEFKAGDVLFGKLRPYLAKAWSASFDGKCSSEFWVMCPVKLTSSFLLYTVLSNHFIANIDHSTFGVKMPRAEWEYAGNQLICCPTIAEQKNITNYLDKKCAEIDAIIAAKEKTNELLKERRQSIIYEAVTKGLDPTAPMKDSGIEWIGEIPESWDCKKIKYAFTLLAGATPKSGNEEYWDGDIVWITPADYTTEDMYIYAGHKTITDEGLNSCATTIIPEESIIFSKRAPIGLVAINKVPLCTNQGCISCIPNKDVDSKFYYYVMSAFTKEFDLFGSGTTFKEISAEAFANFVLPYTAIEEQKEIAAYLDLKCHEINGLISYNNSTIEKLKEYRQSVIYEAVTGKVEI